MSVRFQNTNRTHGQPPSYYVDNRVYPYAYARTEWATRTSRRIHDGLALTSNYGLDTVSDDINSSPYSSPYYINGRYNSDNLVSQRGNSASVQGTKFLLSIHDDVQDFTEDDIQTTIKMWQGKQIKFKMNYTGKIVANTITLKNTDACTGILSIYLSTKEDGVPIYETAIDLCEVSTDKFEHFTLRGMTPVLAKASPKGEIWVRMEIWDEIAPERSANPFNTDHEIEIAATGLSGHYEAVTKLTDKNTPATGEKYTYKKLPSRPLIGFVYNDYTSIPVDRVGNEKTGATVSDAGYRYDIFCIKDSTHAEMVIYDKEMNKVVEDTDIKVDGRAEQILIAQVVDTDRNNWVYYVDSYSPLQRFKIGEWNSEEVKSAQGSDTDPVIGASLLLFHNNRLYIGGFAADKNLFQCSSIEAEGPDFTTFPYRWYTPNLSPKLTTLNPPTALVEYESDTIMILGKNSYSIFTTNTSIENTSSSNDLGMPSQVSSFTDSVGVQSQGDVVNYKGVLYSFDQKEGIRRFNGSTWQVITNNIQSYYDRVDMDKPRKMWGFSNKLYFNYTDRIDGKAKCIVWDSEMNYQQYPWFQDSDLPFCDARYDESEDIVGIHPDYPCIMKLYAEDTWRRLDTPITFERHTKFVAIPGNAQDAILRRVHNTVLANCNRWWYFGIATDKHVLEQVRGLEAWWRIPCWATVEKEDPAESPFNAQDIYEEDSTARLSITNINIHCTSMQCKIKAKTFRDQASLLMTLFEVGVRQYN